MTRVAWFHCFAGIAGDMALGSLLDAGADRTEVVALLERLPVGGWELRVDEVLRGGISCTRATVHVHENDAAGPGGAVVSRTHRDLAQAVLAASLPLRVERRALATFAALAEVEGEIHCTDPADVHFHEVGGHDALVEIVGTAAALEVLGIDTVQVSAVAVGTGTVRAAHGILPNPAPAVLRLLEGFSTYGRPVPLELTTPTGAALLRALASTTCATASVTAPPTTPPTTFSTTPRPGDSGVATGSDVGPRAAGITVPMPAMTVRASGYGAGAAELDTIPNCTQVVVGDAPALRPGSGAGQPVTVLEANLDDATGEQLALAVAALLEQGALDAWITPVLMKKGRPGHTMHVLSDPAAAEALADVLRRMTGSFGVRALAGERWPEARRVEEVIVEGQPVRMKVGRTRVKAEPEDVARVAATTGLGAHDVASRAEEAWRHGPRRDG